MIYANKTSKFAKKILSNCLILQFSATQTILFYNYKLHKNEAPEVFAPAGRDCTFEGFGVPIIGETVTREGVFNLYDRTCGR